MNTDPDAVQHSCSFAHRWTYDVFISFRGENSFTQHLYNALQRLGILTVMNDDDDDDDATLQREERGDEISQTLVINSIEQSRIAVVVLSNSYASSAWCLDELVKILECVKGKGQIIIPIFYGVDPSQVRHQRGSFGKTFSKHLDRFKSSQEKVQKWSSALHEAANISGFHYTYGCGSEYELIERIVREIWSKMNGTLLHVANYPVGLESRLQELNSLLVADCDHDVVKRVGIWGIGGIGKTTLARALYNVIADQFEGFSFLHLNGVREHDLGLVQLQDTLKENIKLGDVNRRVKNRLCRKKVLLVLDDVHKSEQLLQIIGGGCEWFGSGSRIIITTRDRHLLDCCGVETQYEVKGFNHQEALQLLCWSAFQTNVVDPSYEDVLNRALLYANGLPLALQVIGSKLYCKTIDEWQSVLDKYERIPRELLRVSYEDLGQVENTVSLDIACFLKGYRSESVANMLQQTRGLCPHPNSGKRKDNFFYCSNDLELNCYPLLKRHRKFLDMGAFQTPNMHQQNNLGSVAQNIPKRCKTVFEDGGKYSTVYSEAGMKWDIEWLSLLSSLQPLEGVNRISNPLVSKTMSDISSEKDVKLNEFCKICRRIHWGKSKQVSIKPGAQVCVQSNQTLVEKNHSHVPERRGNLGSVSEEADGDLIAVEHYTDHVDSSLNDIAVNANYASLASEATALSLLIDTETNTESVDTKLSEETKKTLQILQDCLSKRFSFLLDPGQSRLMKTIFDSLLSLSADDGISVRMRSVILQLSRSFTRWNRDYDAASVKLELTTADLSKVDKLEVDIEANLKKFKEVDLLEDELCSQLASLQERKRELEEHIHDITQEITEFGLPGDTVSVLKKE